MKEFKERHGSDAAKGGLSSAMATPMKDASKPNTPGSKRKKAAIKEENADDDETLVDTPTKKAKKTKKEVKAESEDSTSQPALQYRFVFCFFPFV